MLTFYQLLDGFLDQSTKKVCYRTYGYLRARYFPPWSAHPTFLQIDDWHRGLVHIPHHANKALDLVKAAYTWAIRHGLYPGPNPATGVPRHRTFSRERVLTSQELAVLVNTLDMLPRKLSALLVVLLTTGCRLSEARRMQPQHVNLVTGAWVQPQTKNGKPHTTTQARTALAVVPPRTPYYFDGTDGRCHSLGGAEKAWKRVRRTLGLADVRLHDFRRTFATHLYLATKDDFLVKRNLNHTNPSVTAIYVRISQEEVATALQAQADRFFALLRQAGPLALPALTHGAVAPLAFC